MKHKRTTGRETKLTLRLSPLDKRAFESVARMKGLDMSGYVRWFIKREIRKAQAA